MASNAPLEKLPTGVELNGRMLRISFYYRGKRHRESLGLSPTKQNIKFAKQKREAILYEIKLGTFSYASHFPNSKNASGKPGAREVGSLAMEYLEYKKQEVRGSTYRKYLSVMKTFLEIYGAQRSCDTLSPRSLIQMRHELIQGRSARTINRALVTIKSFLAWLHKMEYVSKNHADILDRVKEPDSDIRPFSMEEINRVLSHCTQEQHRNMITLLVYTGLRSGELCALAWEDVDFDNRTILVRRSTYDIRGLKTTKTDTERTVDLMPPAVEALRAQQRLTYLFPTKEYNIELPDKSFRKEKIRIVFNPKVVRTQKGSDYNYYGKRGLGKIWRAVCEKAMIEYRNQYQLRHTYASWMITHANANVSYLAQQMGHKNITMVSKVYGKWLKESNKKESDRIWQELLKVAQNTF